MLPMKQPIDCSVFELGVDYNPSTTIGNTLSVEDLELRRIEFIRLTWVDFANIVRFRILPISYFKKLLESQRAGIAIAKAMLGVISGSLVEGFNSTGEYFLVPDMASIRACPYAPGHATVMGVFEDKVPLAKTDGTSRMDTSLCPRTTLKRIVDEARDCCGAEFLVGFESEFTLLKGDSTVEAVGNHWSSSSAGLRTGAPATIVIEEIARAVVASGIELQMAHGEAGPGQYEIATGPLPPLEAADALIHTREIIYNIASSHGLRATFAPQVFLNVPGSGAHAHISVHPTRADSPPCDKGMSQLQSRFLAGILAHLPSLPALTQPTPASYQRVADGVWSGGTYVCWGTENRECPVRLTNAAFPASRRFEMRFLDATANPYLALAGILGAGAQGIREKLELRIGDCSGPKNAAEMSEDERLELGICKRMPLAWDEARSNFASDDELRNILGHELVEKYLSVNEALGNFLEKEDDYNASLTRLIELY